MTILFFLPSKIINKIATILAVVLLYLLWRIPESIAFSTNIGSRKVATTTRTLAAFLSIDGMDIENEDDAQLLIAGKYGSLCKHCLERLPVKELRVGEETSVYTRVLKKIKIGSTTDPMLALHRFKIWWLRPVFQHPIPAETLLLLEKIEQRHQQQQQQKGQQTGVGNYRNKDNMKEIKIMQYRLVLPVVLPLENGKSFASSSIRGKLTEEGQEEVLLYSNHHSTGLYVGFAEDPYVLIQEGVNLATQLWNAAHDTTATTIETTTRIMPTKNNNIVLNKLGWCSWNAFYTDVSGPKVVEAIRSLQQDHKIPIRWMILDDGWQHITADRPSVSQTEEILPSSSAVSEVDNTLDGNQWCQRLQSLREDPQKFKELSLRQTVKQLREDLSIEAVWVWHTLAGYWLGLNTASAAFSGENSTIRSKMQYPHFPPGILDNDASASLEASIEKGIGIATNATDFFREYHTNYLSSTCGVDGVKVDSQGVIGILRPEKPDCLTSHDDIRSKKVENKHQSLSTGAPIIRLQDALAQSVSKNFCNDKNNKEQDVREQQSPSIIHCMAHAPEIFYRLPSLYKEKSESGPTQTQNLPLFRAADDFYPDNPHSHGPQIVACAYNSLLFQHVAIPDWDMFAASNNTDPAIVKLHTLARAISGGPTYFSSSSEELMKFEGQNSWIDWVCCTDGTTLPCRGSALPVKSCLVQDPLVSTASPMILWNTNGGPTSTCSGIFGLFCIAGCGTWDYSKLSYVSNTEPDDLKDEVFQVNISPDLIPFFSRQNYAVTPFLAVSFFSQTVHVLASPSESLSFPLQQLESEAVSIFPLLKVPVKVDGVSTTLEVAVLGLEGKINGGGAVINLQSNTQSSIQITTRGCGNLLVALRSLDSTISRSLLLTDNSICVSMDEDNTTDYKILTAPKPGSSVTNSKDSNGRLRNILLNLGFAVLLIKIPPPGKCDRLVSITFGR